MIMRTRHPNLFGYSLLAVTLFSLAAALTTAQEPIPLPIPDPAAAHGDDTTLSTENSGSILVGGPLDVDGTGTSEKIPLTVAPEIDSSTVNSQPAGASDPNIVDGVILHPPELIPRRDTFSSEIGGTDAPHSPEPISPSPIRQTPVPHSTNIATPSVSSPVIESPVIEPPVGEYQWTQPYVQSPITMQPFTVPPPPNQYANPNVIYPQPAQMQRAIVQRPFVQQPVQVVPTQGQFAPQQSTMRVTETTTYRTPQSLAAPQPPPAQPTATSRAIYEQRIRSAPMGYRQVGTLVIAPATAIQPVMAVPRNISPYGGNLTSPAVVPLGYGGPLGPAGQPPQPRPFVPGQPIRNFVRGIGPY